MNELLFYFLFLLLTGIVVFIGGYFRLCICADNDPKFVYIVTALYFLVMTILGIKKYVFDS